MESYFDQHRFDIKLEWGPEGVRALAPQCECLVIVDVMSFSTCVEIATSRGALIFPFPWKDERAIPYGAEKNALVASIKRRFGKSGFSLSPHSLLDIAAGTRLVLPSPNGSASVFLAEQLGARAAIGCLRNASATAKYCGQFKSVGVIACGEKWTGGEMRPALEDYIGAGAIIASLNGIKSPEAQMAQAAFHAAAHAGLADVLEKCSSGYELRERGFQDDVSLCVQLDVSDTACVLHKDCVRAWGEI